MTPNSVLIGTLVAVCAKRRIKRLRPRDDVSVARDATTIQLVNWCFEPSKPLGTISLSGLRETFTNRYIVEKANKAEIRPKEQSKKAEICGEELRNKIQLKGPKRQKQTQEQNTKEWVSSVGLCQKHKPQHPHHVKVSPRGLTPQKWLIFISQ